MAEEAPKTAAPTPETKGKAQPKIVHKLALRTLLAVTGLALLFIGLRSFLEYSKDPNRFGTVNTTDAIAAIEFKDDGQQAVLLKDGGPTLRSPDYSAGSTERDLAWQPDGNRLYYVSDRDKSTFQVYRWRPVEKGESEARTIGTRGKSNPTFVPGGDAASELLICSGGVVLELDPVKKTTHQILPPLSNEIAVSSDEEGGGGTSQFAGLYGKLGESFSKAQYLPGYDAVAAVMKRDRGEILIVQPLPKGDEKLKQPIPVIAGEKIYFSVAASGLLAYSVEGFQWPSDPPAEMVKNGKVIFPFLNAVGLFKLGDKPAMPVAVSDTRALSFGPIALSPDGEKLLVVAGTTDENGFVPKAMAVMPAKPGGGSVGTPLVDGEIYEPSWHPSGAKIAYIKKVDGRRAVFTINSDGTEDKMVTAEGSYGQPVFSPQQAASKQ